jgi:hypothetical protein
MSDSAIHALAGAAGGIAAMTATYPLIFLSTRAAVETKNEPKVRLFPYRTGGLFAQNFYTLLVLYGGRH